MRPNQNKRIRGRGNGGNNNRRGPNPLTRAYESNGPDVKVRGTAASVAEKYVQLARDAHVAGDPVAAESYLQHAEHYYRIIATAQALQTAQQQQQAGLPVTVEIDDADEDDLDNGLSDRFTFRTPQSFHAPDPNAPAANPNGQPPFMPREGGEPRNDQQREPRRFEPRDRQDFRRDENRGDRNENRGDRGDRSNEFRRNERPSYANDQPGYAPDQGDTGEPREGMPPREGDRPRNDRFPRRDRFRDRNDRPNGDRPAGDRPNGEQRFDRPERNERPDRNERPERNERFERPERPERPEAAEREDRPERNERPERTERPERIDRSERADRPERAERAERPERAPRPERVPVAALAGDSDIGLPSFITQPKRVVPEAAAEAPAPAEPVAATAPKRRARKPKVVEGEPVSEE